MRCESASQSGCFGSITASVRSPIVPIGDAYRRLKLPRQPGGGAAGLTVFTTMRSDALFWASVMSASVKPRLAGRQPSNRGGVPRVMTRVSSRRNLSGWL